MSDVLSQAKEESQVTHEDVLEFLKNNPSFVEDNPEAIELLLPERKRPKRGDVADFQSYMIERLKTDKQEAIEVSKEIVETSRANMNNQQRIHIAVLRMLEASSFDDFIHSITSDLAPILDVDIAVLVVEADGKAIPHIQTSGIRALPEGTIDGWMNGKICMLQDNISGIEAIYGGGATLVKSQILLRIGISMDTPPALLAFGSRDGDMFHEGQATDQILFLAGVIERSFRTWLNVPSA